MLMCSRETDCESALQHVSPQNPSNLQPNVSVPPVSFRLFGRVGEDCHLEALYFENIRIPDRTSSQLPGSSRIVDRIYYTSSLGEL